MKGLRTFGAGAGGLLALALGFTLAVGGCSYAPSFGGVEDLPLPGGADLGDHPYRITAELRDVLNLVPQSAVKVNDVAVGRVTRIRLSDDGWSAKVTMKVNGDIRLPAASTARLEQSSLLGEKYIQLVAPGKHTGSGRYDGLDPDATTPPGPGATPGTSPGPGPTSDPGGTPETGLAAAAGTAATGGAAAAPGGLLHDGSVIPLARTSRNTEVEEVFGALSLLLNGGGVSQLKTITTELNKALGGREPQVRSMLRRVDKLVTDLDDHRGDITDALDGVDRLSSRLATRKKDVGRVLTGLSPGLKTLETQRGSLMTMLRSLDTLSTVAVDTVDRSKDDMVADLKALSPSLKALADAGKDLPGSLQVLLTYPFTDEVLRGVKGDYLNVYLDITAAPGTQVIPPLDLKHGDAGAQADPGKSPEKGAPKQAAPKQAAPKQTTPERSPAGRSLAPESSASAPSGGER